MATLDEETSSIGEESTSLEQEEPQTEPECGPVTSSESEEGTE